MLVTELDDKIRGIIEHEIEIQLESDILNEENKWVFEEFPDPTFSQKDFLLGFIIGKFMYMAWTVFKDNNYDATYSDIEEVYEIIRRRIPEIERKIMDELGI
jgi:threonine synthase